MVIVYRAGAADATRLARLLVRGVRHIGMPNIVAGREIVPELLQGDANGPPRSRRARARILDSPARRAAIVADLRAVRAQLGRGGAAGRAAAIARRDARRSARA